jgi:multiple sugar transport system substrate-binding protein
MKRVAIGLLMLVLAAAWAFSTGQEETKEVTIKVLRHSGYDAGWMEAQSEEFTAQTGIKVEYDLVPYSQLHDKQVVELASGVGAYDVIALTDYWVAEYGKAGWLKPLDGYIADPTVYDESFKIEDIPQSLRNANSVNGKLLAIPWKFNVTVLFYRGDLVSAAPKTWDEMISAAKRLSKDGVYGVGLSLSKASFPTMFWDALYSNGGQMLSSDGKSVGFNNQKGVEALEYLLALNQVAAPGAINRHWDESAALMAQGKTAIDFFVPFLSNIVEDPEKSQVAGKIRYAAIPRKVKSSANISTWALAVTGNSRNPEEAYRFVQFLLGPSKVLDMAVELTGGVVPSRSSVLNAPELKKYPIFVAADAAAKEAYIKPQLAETPTIEDILASYCQMAANGELSAREAIQQAATDINKVLAQ